MRINEDFLDDIQADEVVQKDTDTSTRHYLDFRHSIKLDVLKTDGFIKRVRNVPNRVCQIKILMHMLDVCPMVSNWMIMMTEVNPEKGKAVPVEFTTDSNPVAIVECIEGLKDQMRHEIHICGDFRKVTFVRFVHWTILLVRRVCYLFSYENNLPSMPVGGFKYSPLCGLTFDSVPFQFKKYDLKSISLEDQLNPTHSLQQFLHCYCSMFEIVNTSDFSVMTDIIRKRDVDVLFEEWKVMFKEDYQLAYNMFGISKDIGWRVKSYDRSSEWSTRPFDLMITGTGADKQPFIRMSDLCRILRDSERRYTYRVVFAGQTPGCIVYDELEETDDYLKLPLIKIYNNFQQTIIFDDISLRLDQIEGLMDDKHYTTMTCMCISRCQGWTSWKSGGLYTIRLDNKIDFQNEHNYYWLEYFQNKPHVEFKVRKTKGKTHTTYTLVGGQKK